MSDLKENIREYISYHGKNIKYDNINKHLQSILDDLAKNGEISLGNDKDLAGLPLEIRINIIFKEMGLNIRKGRPGLEDFVVQSPPNVQPNMPIVLEVKSSRKPNINRVNLRQLDDWVFDLSGEDKARKGDTRMEGGQGHFIGGKTILIPAQYKHPSSHKGVMIFNGPIGAEFNDRMVDCINPNDLEFVVKRNICIIPLPVLIEFANIYKTHTSVVGTFWSCVHKTTGILDMP